MCGPFKLESWYSVYVGCKVVGRPKRAKVPLRGFCGGYLYIPYVLEKWQGNVMGCKPGSSLLRAGLCYTFRMGLAWGTVCTKRGCTYGFLRATITYLGPI